MMKNAATPLLCSSAYLSQRSWLLTPTALGHCVSDTRAVTVFACSRSVTERDDDFSEAVVHRPAMPAGIKD
jgi:hypothetical protein